MADKLVLIDGHSIINRAFYGVPDLTNAAGVHTGAVYGFLSIFFKLLDEEKPDYVVVAFDEHAPTFRHKIFAEYKGTRKPMPEELKSQVPILRNLLDAMGVATLSVPGLEADDIMGTLAKKSQAEGMKVSLVSGDRDLLQIADENILIRIPKTKSGKTTVEDYTPARVEEEFGVDPLRFIQLKALMGDSSDNIPGVPKVGPKTASDLMQTYGSIDGIYEHLDEIKGNSVRESLREHRDLADLSLVLATIEINADITLDKEKAKRGDYFTSEAYEIIKELGLKSLYSRFDDATKASVSAPSEKINRPETVVLDTALDLAKVIYDADVDKCGFQFVIDEGNALSGAFATADKIYYYAGTDIECDALKSSIKVLSAKNTVLCFTDIKSQYGVTGYIEPEKLFDAGLANYVLDPLSADHDIENIANAYLGFTPLSVKERFGKMSFKESFFTAPDTLKEYTCDGAFISFASYEKIKTELESTGQMNVYRNIELPLSYILYDMENLGILVKARELEEYSERLSGRIDELEKKIHEESGEPDFNINSPKQLGVILFEKMGLSGGKKTKTGYSTSADVLEKLAPDVPFVRDILEYRGLTKLRSTYAEGLKGFIGPDGRIRCKFNQMVTATGRISSSDPNLQNIPVRTELGRELRKVFVPKDGFLFTDADYSQIELRVLASLSKDEALIESYRSGEDIHRITASKVFGVPLDEVTDTLRRNAKAVNFGIVYGISSFGLGENIGISRKEAGEYIKKYFETFPGLKKYLDGLVESAKDKGYSETYFGRRRPIPELKNSNFMTRAFGERVAMNAPIQGTAADIIKLAMISVWKTLRDKGLESRLILQVHDELLIEGPEQEASEVNTFLTECMEKAADLAVKLEISVDTGRSWYEAH
ncbi:MAG: DNA polymerase I [Lachnospiraceae bacterium]|nr:DNA polymerase I [Lachnospiraceae bacterium]